MYKFKLYKHCNDSEPTCIIESSIENYLHTRKIMYELIHYNLISVVELYNTNCHMETLS